MAGKRLFYEVPNGDQVTAAGASIKLRACQLCFLDHYQRQVSGNKVRKYSTMISIDIGRDASRDSNAMICHVGRFDGELVGEFSLGFTSVLHNYLLERERRCGVVF